MTDKAKELILIVEDSPPNRKVLAHLLERMGYRVLACANGQEAWDKLTGKGGQKEAQDVVAVISDIMMPQMNGLRLLRMVRENEQLKDMPFLLVTAVSDKDYIVQAKQLNVSGYILKPITYQRVSAKLNEIFPDKVFPKITA